MQRIFHAYFFRRATTAAVRAILYNSHYLQLHLLTEPIQFQALAELSLASLHQAIGLRNYLTLQSFLVLHTPIIYFIFCVGCVSE